jgi:hemolysin III
MHAVGLAFALVGMVFLTSKADGLSDVQTASVWIYALGLVMTFAMSAVYNFWPRSSAKLMLRRFDQSVIFLFIAASYTPFIVHVQNEPNRGLLAAIWTAAWIGVILKLGYPGRFERLSIILCMALGWSGLFAYDAVFSQYPASTICLIASGGVLYSVGVIFHLWDRLRFQNAIWHAFVVGAAALQFCAVFNSVSAAVAGVRQQGEPLADHYRRHLCESRHASARVTGWVQSFAIPELHGGLLLWRLGHNHQGLVLPG